MAETEVQQSNSRRIAKNALMLYIRMFLSMIVGLYTSRVVLNTLGVEDYGIYGVVGGVVSMMGFLNASMSGATSRFITFELGKGNTQRLKDTFSSAMIVHIGIAVVVFIVAETIGLWFLNNKLVIPENRMYAANWVYQLSIFSAMLGITQVPYNACIIAHERMGIYAYIEILNVSLKLLIVYLLLIGDFDKLILYAILTLAVSVIVIMTYRIYCIRNFSECHFHWIWDKKILKPLLSFSGWDLFNNISITIRVQSIPLLLNLYFGIVVNAANSIAQNFVGVSNGFIYNIINAFRPYIIKQYAQNQLENVQRSINFAVMISVLISAIIIIPIYIELDFILIFWLIKVPPYTVDFIKLLLLSNIISLINTIILSGIYASGKNIGSSCFSCILSFCCVFCVWVAFKYITEPVFAYIIQLLMFIFNLLINTIILKRQIPQFNVITLSKVFLKCFLIIFVSFFFSIMIQSYYEESIQRFVIVLCSNSLIIFILSYTFILPHSLKLKILEKLKSFL